MIPFGFYTDPEQTDPTFDPGVDGVPCPACHKPLTRDDLRTVSLMEIGGTRSLFYRLHKSCAVGLSREQQVDFDEQVMQQAGQAGGGEA